MRFTISSHEHKELIDITDQVQKCITQSKVKEGICNVFVTHATAAVIINENYDPNICLDFIKAIDQAIPDHNNYLHDSVDNNAQAHIKAAIIGPSETIPVKGGQLVLGTWQSLMFVELDGPRKNRNIEVTVVSS